MDEAGRDHGANDAFRILVAGGYGFFGHRLVERLSRQRGLDIVVAGRSLAAAQALVDRLQPSSAARLSAHAVDTQAADMAATLRTLGIHLLLNVTGPFQGADYALAEACIAAGCHYVDVADGREFVAGIGRLQSRAAAAGVTVVSGASTVPALTSTVVDALAADLSRVAAIDIGISPGNRTERGLATVRGVMSYCGQPIPSNSDRAVIGWRGTHEHAYSAPVGARLLSPCDVPDLVLLPDRYPGSPVVSFNAGLELRWLHRATNALAFVAQQGWVRNWADHAGALKVMADWVKTWGSEDGAMHVTVDGTLADGTVVQRAWELVATRGDGPYVPVLAAAAMVRKLAAGAITDRGAFPCIGFLSLDDFRREAEGLAITLPEPVR